MRRAIKATLFHCSSTDKNPRHHECPVGKNGWRFYNRSLAKEQQL